MRFLEKIQRLPEKKRKVILWSIVTVLAVSLLFWWLNSFQNRVKGFQKEELIEELNLPEIEIPQMPEINYGQ